MNLKETFNKLCDKLKEFSLRHLLHKLYKKLKLKGKEILVSGRRGTGKSTLTDFIKDGYNTNKKREFTLITESYDIKWEELLSEDFEKVTDCKGHDYIDNEEISRVDKAKIILYLFNVKTILSNEEEQEIKQIKAELKILNKHLNNCVKNKKFIAIGTHIDCIKGFDKNENKIIKELKGNIHIQEIQNICPNLSNIEYMSLHNKYIEKYVKQLIKTLLKGEKN